MRPGASTPALAANGHDCAVSTSFECATTKPVINPNATCDAMNQPQAIRWLSAGLIRRRVDATRAVHKTGARKLPQKAVKRDGIIGKIAAQSKPTSNEMMP